MPFSGWLSPLCPPSQSTVVFAACYAIGRMDCGFVDLTVCCAFCDVKGRGIIGE